MSNVYYTDTDNTIHLGKEIGRGGEGKVYLVNGYPSEVAKIYIKQQTPDVHRKILTMVQNPPRDPTVNGQTKHRSIAWPSDILYSDRQKTEFAGFIMPKVDTKIFTKLLYYISPNDRLKSFQGGFTWLHLYTSGFNLASCLAAIHERGYCVGDINESNILVAPTTPLTIIDCDSFQVEDPSSKKMWRCKVGKADYTAPEILDYRYEDIDRTKETDCFSLAIILFQLLMEGFHPYASSGKLVADAPTTRDKIKKGIFPYKNSMKGIAPPRDAPSFDILNPEIQELFNGCFHIGHKNPSARPSAKEWMEVLKKGSHHFKKCATNENHRFLDHLGTCPWCDKARKTGKESFPSPVGQQIFLPDPTDQTVSLDDRKTWLLPYIEMALVDGPPTPEEEEYLIDQGLKLLIPQNETKSLITDKIKKRGFARVLTREGDPKLEIADESGKEKRSFDFKNMRLGATSSITLTVKNGGGGTLDAKIKTNRSWLIVDTNRIHQSKLPQRITITVDPRKVKSCNKLGGNGKGEIKIAYKKGAYEKEEIISVNFNIEIEENVLGRFRKDLAAAFVLIGIPVGHIVGHYFRNSATELFLFIASIIAGIRVYRILSDEGGWTGFLINIGAFLVYATVVISVLGEVPILLYFLMVAPLFFLLGRYLSKKLFHYRKDIIHIIWTATGILSLLIIVVFSFAKQEQEVKKFSQESVKDVVNNYKENIRTDSIIMDYLNRIVVYNNGVEARYSIDDKYFVLKPNLRRHHNVTKADQQLIFHSVLGRRQTTIDASKPMKYGLITVNWSRLDQKEHYAKIEPEALQRFGFYNQADDSNGKKAKLSAIRVRLPKESVFGSNLLSKNYNSRTSGYFTMPLDLRNVSNCVQEVRIEFADGHSFEKTRDMCVHYHMFINYNNFF